MAEERYTEQLRPMPLYGCKKLYEGCRSLSLPVQRMIWDMDEKGEWCGRIKGIDDFYYATRRDTVKQSNGSI